MPENPPTVVHSHPADRWQAWRTAHADLDAVVKLVTEFLRASRVPCNDCVSPAILDALARADPDHLRGLLAAAIQRLTDYGYGPERLVPPFSQPRPEDTWPSGTQFLERYGQDPWEG
jgi:hypothetical protein